MRHNTRVVTDRRPAPVATVVSWVVAFFTYGYMIPWAVAATRGKSNHWTIFWVNLLLGWTIVGWLVAIVMACTAHRIAGFLVEDDPTWAPRY